MIKNEWLKTGIVLAVLVIVGAVFWYLVIYIPQRDKANLDFEQQQADQATANKQQQLESDQQAQLSQAQQNCTNNAAEAIKNDTTNNTSSSSIIQTQYDSQTNTCYAYISSVLTLLAIKTITISTYIMDVDTRQSLAACSTLYGDYASPQSCSVNKKPVTLQVFNAYKSSIFGD